MNNSIDLLAALANLETMKGWKDITLRFLIFGVLSVLVIEICHLTGLVTPAFAFGMAWGSLGTYDRMRRR